MFDVLSRGFKSATLALQGKTQLSEENLAPALREVRASLLQADVEIGVVRDFLDKVQRASLEKIVPLKVAGQTVRLTPQDWFVKACHDELVELMGPVDTSLDLVGRPAIVLMVGLQGSGKTTTSAKIAKMLVAGGHKPLLVAADVYRPAAVDQLQMLGRKLGVPVYHQAGASPVDLARQALVEARNTGRDVVIVDTAGRTTVDDAMMQEVVDIKAAVNPKNTLLVVDAMIGQDAVRTAKTFDERVDFTGFVLTKLDGDARGGAALAIKAVTGKPVKFLGQGEALDKLEEFRPDGLAQRILGLGDVVGLVQDFEKHIDRDTAEKDAQKLLRGDFGYDDFVSQLNTVRKLGPLREIMSKLPIVGGMVDQIPEEALDDSEMDRTLAIIQSMTRQERSFPDVIDPSRMRRIAGGAGREVADVQSLHERFLQARQMMAGLGQMMGNPGAMARMQQMLGGGGMGGMGGLGQMMGGMPGMGLPGLPGLPGGADGGQRRSMSGDDKIARRKKQRDARKARKKNRK